MKGMLIALSGPSGVGKGTIYHELLKRMDNLSVSVSVTTRAPRNGEVDGSHYYFVSKEKFSEMIAAGEFLEYAETVGNMYGTPKAAVESSLSSGVDVILEIDVKGVHQIEKSMPDCLSIFVLPPSLDELERRLRFRNSEDEIQRCSRMELAKSEIMEAVSFDYRVVNDDLDQSVEQIINIIKTEKRRRNTNVD